VAPIFRFLDLYPEIRNRIYAFIVVEPDAIELHNVSSP
jgi:hypothetical protein